MLNTYRHNGFLEKWGCIFFFFFGFFFFWGGTRYLKNMLSGANVWNSMTGCVFTASTICVVEIDRNKLIKLIGTIQEKKGTQPLCTIRQFDIEPHHITCPTHTNNASHFNALALVE